MSCRQYRRRRRAALRQPPAWAGPLSLPCGGWLRAMLPLLETHCSIAPLTFLASILHSGIANLGLRPRLATAANHSCCPHPHPFLARWNNADPQMCATSNTLSSLAAALNACSGRATLWCASGQMRWAQKGASSMKACSARPALCGRVRPPSCACTLRSRYVMHDLPGGHVVHGTCAWHLHTLGECTVSYPCPTCVLHSVLSGVLCMSYSFLC